jgi:hypothetical protein
MHLLRALVVVTTAALAAAGTAGAACNVSNVCNAAQLASCCPGGTSCTIDGVVNIANQPDCTLDFELKNVAVVAGGRIVVGSGNRLSIMAGSFRVTRGKVLARGTHGVPPAGTPGGEVAITTKGPVVIEQDAEIDVSGGGPSTGGGRFLVTAEGPISVAAATLHADGFETSLAGDIRLAADGPIDMMGNPLEIAAEGGGGGRIEIESKDAVTIASSGRIRTNVLDNGPGLGGAIEVSGASVTSSAIMEAQGGSGEITITAHTGGLVVDREILGLSVDAEVDLAGSIILITETLTTGTLRVDAPLSARGLAADVGGGQIAIDSASTVAFSTDPGHTDTINVSGFGSGASEVEIRAIGDVGLDGDIIGVDDPGMLLTVASGRTVRIGGDVTATGRVGFDAEGGEIDVDADHDVIIERGVVLDASAAGFADGGIIDIAAGHDLILQAEQGGQAAANLRTDSGTTGGTGGGIELAAGETDFRGYGQTGNLTMGGVVSAKAAGAPSEGGTIDLSGCQIEIGGDGVLDATAAVGFGGTTSISARQALHLASGAEVKAHLSNTVFHLPGTPPAVDPGATVTPPFTTLPRQACTTPGVPEIGCLHPCPTCGNGTVEGDWEQCEPAPGSTHCDQPFCNQRCRIDSACEILACQDTFCDPVGSCFHLNQRNGTDCTPGESFCTGPMACQAGSCEQIDPPPPGCAAFCDEQQNVLCPDTDSDPCTQNRFCDGETCVYDPPVEPPFCCHNTAECEGVQSCSICDLETIIDPETNVCELIPNCCLADADCDDGNPCTTNTCNTGAKTCNAPGLLNGAQLGCGVVGPNDPPTCFVGTQCVAGTCDIGDPEACPDDGDPCTEEVTDSSGCCVHQVISESCCSDGHPTCPGMVNACTNITCNTQTNECESEVEPNCSPCTVTDECPEPDNPCATVTCNQLAGKCEQTIDPTCTPCTTVDVCPPASGPCNGVICNDDDRCQETIIPGCRTCTTQAQCNPLGPATGPCAAEVCTAGKCAPNLGRPDCTDGNNDSEDECVVTNGQPSCVHTCIDDRPCSDGNVCNGVESRVNCRCATVQPAPACAGTDPCTDYGCDPATGCTTEAMTLAPAVACRLGVFTDVLAGLTPLQISKGTKKKMAKLATTIRSKTQASTTGSVKARTKAAKTAQSQLNALTKLVNKQKKIPPAMLETMRDALQKAGVELAGVRAAITS